MSDSRPATDAGLLAPAWAGTYAVAGLSDEAWLDAMVRVESALLRVQARHGMVPERVVPVILAAWAERLDVTALATAARDAANPVVGLVQALTAAVAAVDADAARYVHLGGTSQDILDSATMVLAAEVLDRIAADLDLVAGHLARLAAEHRCTPMPGRTLTQHAVPITFGLKAAGWLHLVTQSRDRVCALRETGLPVQLGGAAGTLAAYAGYADRDGDEGPARALELVAPLAAELGLAPALLPWHALRVPVSDLGAVLSLVTGALGKIALDVQGMSRTEVGEVTEPAATGRGASSAMPQKRNPVLATMIVSAARQVPAYAAVLAQAMLSEDERAAGMWQAEWQPLRECLRLAAGAAATAVELTAGLEVHPEAMAGNLALTDGAVVAERLNVELAPLIGKSAAKALLGDAARSGQPFATALAGLEPVRALLTGTGQDIADLIDPTRYLGAAELLVDAVLARYGRPV